MQLRGSTLARALLRLAGWRILFDGLPAAQGVAIVYPHTSNWDFVVGLLAKWGIGIPVTFWGKDSLFRIPLLGRWMRWVGGVPVDRASAHGFTHQARHRRALLGIGVIGASRHFTAHRVRGHLHTIVSPGHATQAGLEGVEQRTRR